MYEKHKGALYDGGRGGIYILLFCANAVKCKTLGHLLFVSEC